jgi:hypothetical protein
MANKVLLIVFFAFLGFGAAAFVRSKNQAEISGITYHAPVLSPSENNSNNNPVEPIKPAKVNLSVPFIVESPEGSWKGNWINACEEASMTMVEKFYQGQSQIPNTEAEAFMKTLFAYENNKYGSNANSDATRTVDIIDNNTIYKGLIKDNPTIEDIKEELRHGRPVISLHYGFALNNKNIPFLATGSAYHMIVIKGYDDDKKVFITNDDGDKETGADHEYDYDLFMNSIHDYIYATAKTNGPARVIFTYPN